VVVRELRAEDVRAGAYVLSPGFIVYEVVVSPDDSPYQWVLLENIRNPIFKPGRQQQRLAYMLTSYKLVKEAATVLVA
jgi:hypothetical protein